MNKYLVATLLALVSCLSLSTCQMSNSSLPTLKTVPYVDLSRFMGDWYVIASIPTFIEKTAHNAVERYELDDNGKIKTTFTFNEGAFDGEQKRYHPTGFVQDTNSNAIWGMQFIWPIKADYRIMYLSNDYQVTVVGRNRRDYVWIMARTPSIPAPIYADIENLLIQQGYDIAQLRRVPHHTPISTTAIGDSQ